MPRLLTSVEKGGFHSLGGRLEKGRKEKSYCIKLIEVLLIFDLTTLSRPMFSMPYACGGLAGQL